MLFQLLLYLCTASPDFNIAQELITPKLTRQIPSMSVFVRLNHCGEGSKSHSHTCMRMSNIFDKLLEKQNILQKLE